MRSVLSIRCRPVQTGRAAGIRTGMTGIRDTFNHSMLQASLDRGAAMPASVFRLGLIPDSGVGTACVLPRGSGAAATSRHAHAIATGLPQLPAVACSGGRGLEHPGYLLGGRWAMHSAGARHRFCGLASPVGARAAGGPASVEPALRRRQPARPPWLAASGPHAGDSEGPGHFPQRPQAARGSSTATAIGAYPAIGFATKPSGQSQAGALPSGAWA